MSGQEVGVAKLRVGVLGATGVAGQEFLSALADHPWFEVTAVAASDRSAGRALRAALTDSDGALKWLMPGAPPESILGLRLYGPKSLPAEEVSLIFSAVESEPARELEPIYAQRLPVISAASAFRMDEDVPLCIPQVNPDHLALIDSQRRRRGFRGFIAPIPNCTTTGLAIALKPLADRFGLRRVVVTSMQAVSGAGRSPGVSALDITDNVIPYIPQEEEKVARETSKILGTLRGERLQAHAVRVSATCTRVAVLDGHTEVVLAELERPASVEEAANVLRGHGEGSEASRLPSAPRHFIEVHDDPFRPQPRRDRDAGSGMTTSVGRLKVDPNFENGLRFVLVSHNTRMGAAKGALLLAELLRERGLLRG
jgi:aspartate-semialdehyde dehydrogenase